MHTSLLRCNPFHKPSVEEVLTYAALLKMTMNAELEMIWKEVVKSCLGVMLLWSNF